MMKPSKKRAAQLSALINAVQVYDNMGKEEMHKPDHDNEIVAKAMKWCDENIRSLNEEFGTTLGGFKYNTGRNKNVK